MQLRTILPESASVDIEKGRFFFKSLNNFKTSPTPYRSHMPKTDQVQFERSFSFSGNCRKSHFIVLNAENYPNCEMVHLSNLFSLNQLAQTANITNIVGANGSSSFILYISPHTNYRIICAFYHSLYY